MQVKICGITEVNQAQEIVSLGADLIGFICVEQSPRYITPEKIRAIADNLPTKTRKVGVFADHALSAIAQIVKQANLTTVQLHGQESPEFCHQLRQIVAPDIKLIKAFRIKSAQTLDLTFDYLDCVDTLLLDAYHPKLLGGTGKTIPWQDLASFKPQLPWMLAGGLTPDNLTEALTGLQPDGIDLSSGVERSPGDKDLFQVAKLFRVINNQ